VRQEFLLLLCMTALPACAILNWNIHYYYSLMSQQKPVILSGVKPSGDFTIGNYLGAVRNWTLMQEQYDCLFFIPDLHSITARQDPKDLRQRTFNLAAFYMACGLDVKKNKIFVQSQVPAHAELSWVLSCFTYMGEMNRMTQFKDKSLKNPENINVGLFTYPILMAADILLYNTSVVPVGEDQKQHLEIARDIAERFNKIYGETFIIPEPYINEQGARIMGLQNPESKMSKSEQNPKDSLLLLDTPEVLRKKVKSAVTDSEGTIRYDKKRAGVANLMTIYSLLSGKKYDEIEVLYEGKGYGDFKSDLAELVVEMLTPIQQKYQELQNNPEYVRSILEEGRVEATKRAEVMLRDVYEKVGFMR